MSEIINYFTAFISGYLVFVAGAAVISIMIWGLTRVIKAGQGSVGGAISSDDLVGFDAGNFNGAEGLESQSWNEDHEV